MRLLAFRITNFRSIVDSGWVPFSPDGITVLVGQNESGKSSVLEALYFALSNEKPTTDDFRIGAEKPEIHIRVGITSDEVSVILSKLSPVALTALQNYLKEHQEFVELECGWYDDTAEGKPVLMSYIQATDPRVEELLKTTREATEAEAAGLPPSDVEISATRLAVTPSPLGAPSTAPSKTDDIGVEIWNALPLAVLFNEESGRLPNQVDIDDKDQPAGPGAKAAQNFLQIADINLPQLIKGDRRARENMLNRANSRVSEDFNSFWSQTIGKSNQLSLKCDIDYYSAANPEKVGKPHLVFWVCDGDTQLYPKQRSQGVRWFVSFYLQLKASEKAKNHRVFLLDEPGSNLHSKAQGDVLRLINKLGKETSTVVYSTHSPQMIEYPKLFRVHAVQRDGEIDDSPTRVIDAHRLGTASTDTLSPILTAMGADLSQHQVVRKTNNVLLEEMSGFYYLTSFWRLLNIKSEAHFIAATGVNKIEALANMFRGWGLDFVVAVDDDKQGREAFKSMKRELFGDDHELASRKLIKFPGFAGIEDVFSKADFGKLVLAEDGAIIAGTNAEYVKASGRSKPVLAFNFAMAVDNGNIGLDQISTETKTNIQKITFLLTERLK